MVDLGQEIGPLPLGAWIAVVGGGLGIAWYTRSRGGGNTEPVIVEDGSGTPGVGQGVGWVAVPPPTTAPPTNAPVEFQTNEEWGRAAINRLIADGYDPNVVDSAIRKYLESSPLSVQEYALTRFALAKLGSPPVPLPIPPDPPTQAPGPVAPPPVVQPPPVVAPPPPPPAVPQLRMVVVTPWPSRRSTLSGIAQEFYGNGNRWPDLYNANRKGTTRPDGSPGYISNPHYLRPGDIVYVP